MSSSGALSSWRPSLVAVAVVVAGSACATVQKPAQHAHHHRRRAAAKSAPPHTPPSAPPAQAPPLAEAPSAEPPNAEAPVEATPAETLPPQEGLASYYADALAGHRTASGERYRPSDRTCAHRTLPFGTILEITVVDTGAVSHCRVNDRGPYARARVLDVSKRVARELGMLGPGVLRVRIRPAPDGGA